MAERHASSRPDPTRRHGCPLHGVTAGLDPAISREADGPVKPGDDDIERSASQTTTRTTGGRPLQREMVAIAGVELELFQDGDGPPLLFLHGAQGFVPEHPYVRLLSAGHRLIAPSHPGFGKSSLPDWIDAMDDIAVHPSRNARPTGLDRGGRARLFDRRLDRRELARRHHGWCAGLCWSVPSA